MRELELADRSLVERGGVSVIGRKNCGKRLRILDGRLWPVTGITNETNGFRYLTRVPKDLN